MPSQTNTRLPHKEPLIFIGSLKEESSTKIIFRAHFPIIPTLAMFCEAAAQGSSFFPLSPNCSMGVVTSFRNTKLITQPLHRDTLIVISILHTLGDSYLFGFEAFAHESEDTVARGEIAVFYTSL